LKRQNSVEKKKVKKKVKSLPRQACTQTREMMIIPNTIRDVRKNVEKKKKKKTTSMSSHGGAGSVGKEMQIIPKISNVI
jgi:hypothetical protein